MSEKDQHICDKVRAKSPSYNHPQTDLQPCNRCGGVPSLTQGDTTFFIFCPNSRCCNVGVIEKHILMARAVWNVMQKVVEPVLQKPLLS